MKVEFVAEMKNCDAKRFVSGDYGAKIVLLLSNPKADLLADINALLAGPVNQQQSLTVTLSDGRE